MQASCEGDMGADPTTDPPPVPAEDAVLQGSGQTSEESSSWPVGRVVLLLFRGIMFKHLCCSADTDSDFINFEKAFVLEAFAFEAELELERT